jgi:hypothetical protein
MHAPPAAVRGGLAGRYSERSQSVGVLRQPGRARDGPTQPSRTSEGEWSVARPADDSLLVSELGTAPNVGKLPSTPGRASWSAVPTVPRDASGII